jgi:WhiB family transcriptional regulator, redox-sensing transcriptional regulator
MSDKNHEYAEGYALDAQRATELIATELTELANDLTAYASRFSKTLDPESRSTPTGLAADVVARFTNGVGTIGSSRLWTVIYSAGKAEKYLFTTHTKEVTPMTEKDWRVQARCREVDPELFFPVGMTWYMKDLPQESRAKAICRGCPVISECLNWAIDTRDAFAIAGGMTPEERRGLEKLIA